MKRPGPLPRQQSKRRRMRRRYRLDDPTKDAQLAFLRDVARREHGMCACCGKPPAEGERLQAHHIFPQRAIKRHVRGLKLDPAAATLLLRRLLWDPRNGRGVRADCHANDLTRSRPFTWAIITGDALAFADELGVRWWLERHYPQEGGTEC